MRVVLFFDGKNHMKDLRRSTSDRWLDHGALAEWVVERVGGTRFVGAYYYTGVEPSADSGVDRTALGDLLLEIERRPGFFVKRFDRRSATRHCPHCDSPITYTEEKQVDTSLVVDLVTLAERDTFDVAVVFSGDLDIAPGLDAIHALGKQGWVATFGDAGLSRGLRRQAWDTIDLAGHIEDFAHPELTETQVANRLPVSPESVDSEVYRELQRAQGHFGAGGGFVGAHYFIHRWKGHAIPDGPEERRQALQRLMAVDRVQTYAVDGKTALRTLPDDDDVDEETIEIGQVDVVRRKLDTTSS
jgi:uncharacterized LabA/DUF88 family protein